MKKFLFLALIFGTLSGHASTRVYSNVSDGPFKGYSYSLIYDAKSISCIETSKVSDGPFKGSSNKDNVNLSKCDLFIESMNKVERDGECSEKSKLLGKVTSGPFQGESTTLTLTKDCLCLKVVKGSYGPYEGYEHRYIDQLSTCTEDLKVE